MIGDACFKLDAISGVLGESGILTSTQAQTPLPLALWKVRCATSAVHIF